MFKKVIFLLSMFSCINSITAEPQKQLTPQETTIYDELMKKYEQNKQLSVDEINQLLQPKNVSIQKLYSILSEKLSILVQEYYRQRELLTSQKPYQYNYYHSPRYHIGDASGYGMTMLGAIYASAAAAFVATPIAATGLAVKTFMTPSPTQKMISSGLIGTGAVIGTTVPVLTGAFLVLYHLPEWLSKLRETISSGIGGITEAAARGASSLYESFTHNQQNAKNRQQAIRDEMNKINFIMGQLKSLYPELTTSQPTSP